MKKIIDFCEKHGMLPRDGLVLCAVSGGKDSVFLLHALMDLREKFGFSLACAHFNHRLRGVESDRDEDFVRALCAEMGIAFYAGGGDVKEYAGEKGLGTEEAARALRYGFLEKTADETGAARIATAHSADDNVETILLNLARGTGLKGLCGIPPVRGRIIRPMLEVSSREVLGFLEEKGIEFVEDSTNAEDSFSRNRIRHRVVPVLRELAPGFDENVLRCASLLREDESFLGALADGFLEKNRVGNTLPAGALAELPPPVAARALRQIAGGGLSYAHITAVLSLAAGSAPHGEADLPGTRVRREYDSLVFGGAEGGKRLSETTLTPGSAVLFEEAGLKISAELIRDCAEINNSDNNFFFQYDSICGNISVRARKEGDSIRLLGRNCTKSIKKLFSESRLNGSGKHLIPVVCDEKGPIAVYGFGIAGRCEPKAGDDAVHVKIEKI